MSAFLVLNNPVIGVNDDSLEEHNKNIEKLKLVKDKNMTKLYVLLQGSLEDIHIPTLAQYYDVLNEKHHEGFKIIVFPTDIPNYLSTRGKNCTTFYSFGDEKISFEQVIKKRKDLGIEQEIKIQNINLPNKINNFGFYIKPQKEKFVDHFSHVVIGGTFDRLHAGHLLLLSQMALVSNTKKTLIAVSGDVLLKNKKHKELIQSLKERMENANNAYLDIRPELKGVYNVELKDPFGPPIVDETFDCIIVSEETRKGGDKINEIRSEKGMKELYISCIPLIQSKHSEDKLSSSQLRELDFQKLNVKK
eukprot:gene6714-10879_t